MTKKNFEGFIFPKKVYRKIQSPDEFQALCLETTRQQNSAKDVETYLRSLEGFLLMVIRSNEEPDGEVIRCAGVGASHIFCLPAKRTAQLHDATSSLGDVSFAYAIMHSSDRQLDLIKTVTRIGFSIAKIQAREFEYLSGSGRASLGNLITSEGIRITEQAKKLFDAGRSIRDVAELCEVTKYVATRWRKEYFNKNR